MRKIHRQMIAILMVAVVSSTTLFAQNKNYDDIYYSPSKNKVEKSTYEEPQKYVDTTIHRVSSEEIQPLTPVSNTTTEVSDGNTYITNNYYGDYTNYSEEDYYDYAYAARIKRFHRSNVAVVDYYNDYYTNMYWYTYDPMFWGVSIYTTYSWWYPSYYYRSGWYVGTSWGWGGYYWGSYWGGYWGYPYYGYYPSVYSSWHHHHHCHHSGYRDRKSTRLNSSH